MNDDRVAPAPGDGWIKLHRKFEADGHLQRMPYAALRFYIHFLLNMRWRPGDGLQDGQLRTTYTELRDIFSCGYGTISDALSFLRDNGYVTTQQPNRMAPMIVTVHDLAIADCATETVVRTTESIVPTTESVVPHYGISSTALRNQECRTTESVVPLDTESMRDKACRPPEECIKNKAEEGEKTLESLSPSSNAPDLISTGKAKGGRSKDGSPDGYSPEFEQVWAEYPHPIGDEKDRAYRNYRKLRKTESAETLLQAVRNYALVEKGQDRRYHKKAANFFGEHGTWKGFVSLEPGALQVKRSGGAAPRPSNAAWAAHKEGLTSDDTTDVSGAATEE